MKVQKVTCDDTGEVLVFKAGRFKDGYELYLKSKHWRNFRVRMMEELAYECHQCGGISISLQLHHITYKRLGNENKNDVLWLCRTCHAKLTKKMNNIKKRRKERNIEVNHTMNHIVNLLLVLDKSRLEALLSYAEVLNKQQQAKEGKE